MLVGLDVWNEPSRSFAIPGRSIERAAVGYDCKFNPLALGQIQNGADNVYCFAKAADADTFMRRFGGETFEPKQR
ncbi:MAG TPA: hypothetical protein VGN32_05960, partial [Ktedonobacterales bacterium]|nr:hypothetical protein [Ktedonobacterales bacterium]